MGSQYSPVRLSVLIVGAGIAGLTAATALKQAGHKVTIFESSKLLHEVGAAITLSPNGTRVLSKLGFNFEAARGVRMDSVVLYSGATLEKISGTMEGIEERIGFPHRAFHRVDLHGELCELALRDDGIGEKVELLLGARVTRVDVEKAEVEVEDGRAWRGDLVVGADGIHSIVKKAALSWSGVREGEEENEDSGWDIYRWLLDTKAVEDDEEIAGLLKRNTRSTFVVPHEEKTLRLVWYQCRNGEVQNLAVICPAKKGEATREDYNATADKRKILELFSGYHPTLRRLIGQADGMKAWRLRNRSPLPTYVYGKTVLIGDAAHPMLPFNAQGGNQALEDAGALFALLSNLPNKEALSERSKMFDLVRRKRAGRQQIISSVPREQVKDLGKKLHGYEDEGVVVGLGSESLKDRSSRELSYDVFERCREVLNNKTQIPTIS